MKTGELPDDAGAHALDGHREPPRRGCSYANVRWQKSVRRAARSAGRRAARRIDGWALAGEVSARRLTTLAARTPRRRRYGASERPSPTSALTGLVARDSSLAHRDTTEGVLFVPSDRRKARGGEGARLRRFTRRCRVRKDMATSPSSPRFWKPRGGAGDSDEGRQRLATFLAKAAPADEARAVHRARRRKAPAHQLLSGAS